MKKKSKDVKRNQQALSDRLFRQRVVPNKKKEEEKKGSRDRVAAYHSAPDENPEE